MARRILILGGTTEARELAGRLAGHAGLDVTVSLAGRVKDIVPHPVPLRVGGFGGIDGLAAHLATERIDLLVDATHPFADQIARHAVAASAKAGVQMVALRRPPWTATDGDHWQVLDGIAAAAEALGAKRRRVFLALGRQEIDAFAAAGPHAYLVRSIEPIAPRTLADAVYVEARGPFRAADEEALMMAHGIDTLVARNSGGAAGYGKIAAARSLGIAVVLIAPPERPAPRVVATVDAAVDAVLHPLVSGAERGV